MPFNKDLSSFGFVQFTVSLCLLVNLSVPKVFYPNGKLGRFLCLAENMFSLQYSTDKPLRVNYTLSQYLILSNSSCISYTLFYFNFFSYRKGRSITYLTFPAMNNHNFAVYTNCPLRVVYFMRLNVR